MASFDVKVTNAGRIAAVLKNGPQLLMPYLLKAMETIGQGLERHVKVEKLSGQALDARTGNLRRSIFHRVGQTARDDAYTVVGADMRRAPYARVHEFGGTITPKRSKFLAIPIGQARTANGVARFTARDLMAHPAAYGYVGAFIRNNIIFGKKPKTGRSGGHAYSKLGDSNAVPLFVLKPSVTLKAVGYLTSTVAEKRAWARDVVAEAAARGMKEIFPSG